MTSQLKPPNFIFECMGGNAVIASEFRSTSFKSPADAYPRVSRKKLNSLV